MASAANIEETAAKWLIELDAGAGPAEWENLTRWLAASPKHRVAFLRLSKAWNHSDALRKLRPLDCRIDPNLLAHASRELNPQTPAPVPRWRGIGLAVAGTLVATVCAALVWQLSPRLASPVYETSFGGTERITLTDGSKVQLNGDSLLRVEFSPSLRSIVLERGEAFFDVAPDVRRPFQVSAGSTRTIAAQSHFAVRRKSADVVDVQVARGEVAFERARSPMYFGQTGARFVRTLWQGDAASAAPSGVLVRRIGVSTVYRHVAWRRGQVSFLGETLAEAVSEVNRYNRQPLRIADPGIAQQRISGTFEVNDSRSFVASLEDTLHVKAVRGTLVSVKR